MISRKTAVTVLIPLISFALYLLFQQSFLPRDWYGVVYAENGFYELGTAFFFIVAGIAAIRLFWRTPKASHLYRGFYLVFAVASLFVAAEELSYGQHLFGWKSPEWFASNNAKAELNLHNLFGNQPSRLMRRAASLLFPLGFLVLPLIAMARRSAHRLWHHYILPRGELVVLMLVAQACTSLDDVAHAVIGAGLFFRPGEVQEFHWAMASVFYMAILNRRLLGNSIDADATADSPVSSALRKAA